MKKSHLVVQDVGGLIVCEQAFGQVGNWGEGKAKRPVDKHLGRRSTAPAVHQILMQAPIGENTDC